MIDKTVLKRLIVQVFGYPDALNQPFPIDQDAILEFANACITHGKNECATGEWFNYPENKDKLIEGNEYLVETKFNENSESILGIFNFRQSKISKRWEYVTRFAEIKS